MTYSATDPSKFAETMMSAYGDVNAMATAYVAAAQKAQAATMQSLEAMARDMNSAMQESYARAASACKTIMSAKSPQEAADMQAEYLKDCYDSMVANGSKLSEASLHLVKGAMDPLTQQASETMTSVMKKAKIA